MSQQVITTVTAPDNSQIFAERIAARMPTQTDLPIVVDMWGTYIDIELSKDSIQNYHSLLDNARVRNAGRRDLSASRICTTMKEAERLLQIASERKVAIIAWSKDLVILSNVNHPETIKEDEIVSHLRAWDDGWE